MAGDWVMLERPCAALMQFCTHCAMRSLCVQGSEQAEVDAQVRNPEAQRV